MGGRRRQSVGFTITTGPTRCGHERQLGQAHLLLVWQLLHQRPEVIGCQRRDHRHEDSVCASLSPRNRRRRDIRRGGTLCPGSDAEVLVEFEPGRVPGFRFVDIQDELSLLLGRAVDLHTPGSLSRYFRERVVREAQDQYVGA